MRKYSYLYIIAGAAMMTGILLYMTALKIPPRPEIDNAAINEITKQTALCWQIPRQLDQMTFAYRFVVIDREGKLVYASDENLPGTVPSAIRQGFLPMDVTVGTSVVGKALVETFPNDLIAQEQAKLSHAAAAAFILLCMLAAAILFVLYRMVMKPFERLKTFAHKISTGKFDEPLPMDRNNIFGLFTQSFDIMRASLLEAHQKKLLAQRAQKELIAALNHDIKTPVTSIRLTSELLQAVNTDPAVAEKLKLIEMKADQIDRLMNDMLRGALEELEELTVSVASEDSGVLRALFQTADNLSKIRLGDIPSCLVEIDVARMEQVIDNIITNSYKYAATEIDVDFAICKEVLRVDIHDYGKGVRPDEVELICVKFYRGENAKASQKEGEGLGLYIAKQIMEKMGGGLEAFNRDHGFGVRLWIRISR
ncbi:MAG: HAMP domain-containing histidine kinase [Firmicutes bacterium]|nr:HAMP domain-containing histidine kinase [Bacillota bacterium]